MPLSEDDRAVLVELARASQLYEDYLQLAELGRIPTQDEIAAEATVPPVDLPLTLVVRVR